VADSVRRLREWAARPRPRRVLYGLALTLFTVGIAVAWREADLSGFGVGPAAAVAFLGVPLQVLAGAWLMQTLVRGGPSPSLLAASRVVAVGTLSSVLPMLSGTIVRGGALMHWGLSAGRAGWLLMADALIWGAVALLVSGAALFARAPELAYGCLALGLVVGLAAGAWSIRLLGARDVCLVAVWRLLGIVVEVVRLEWCFASLGTSVTLAEAAALAAAAPVSSLFFFLPGGLGVKEALTAALAGAAGLQPADAYIAATLNRLLGLLALSVAEALFVLRTSRASDTGTQE
jgi:hypothetical protein